MAEAADKELKKLALKSPVWNSDNKELFTVSADGWVTYIGTEPVRVFFGVDKRLITTKE